MKQLIPPRKLAGPGSGILFALVFALFALLLHSGETLTPLAKVTADVPAPVTLRLPATYFRLTMYGNEVHYLTTTSSTCPNVVPRGSIVPENSECARLVHAYESHRRSQGLRHYLGLFILYFAAAWLLSAFWRHVTMERARLLRAQVGLLCLMMLGLLVAKAVFLLTGFPAVIAPVLFVPMIAGHFFRRRVVFGLVAIFGLVLSSFVNYDISYVWVISGASLTAALAARGARRIRTFLKSGVLSGWAAIAILVVATLARIGTLGIYDDPTEHFDPRYSLWIAALASGLLSAVLALLLAPFFGGVFGVVSRSRLVDLQDLNQRLLKRIQEKAPGTWEHSRAMANLAEAAVNAIGGNTALVRVGAYYHDVGKSNAPDYFIENQGAKDNPHDDLAPEASTARIFKHVVDGTRLLRQEGIPEDVVAFCYSHHGTSVLEYFWYKTMAEGNPRDLTEQDFTYPGYKPATPETGILMLVDAIEAGARTVDVPDKDAFRDLVQRIVFSKLSQGQLDETGLSLGDLRVVVNTLVDTLVNMYHARIKYPWQTGDTTGATRTQKSSSPPADDGAEEGADELLRESSPSRSEPKQKAPTPVPEGGTPSGSRDQAVGVAKETHSRTQRPEQRMAFEINPPLRDLEEPAWAMISHEAAMAASEEGDDEKEEAVPEDVAAQPTVVMPDGSRAPQIIEDDAPEVAVLEDASAEGYEERRPKRALK